MFIKLQDGDSHREIIVLAEVLKTGKLLPKCSVKYAGDYEVKATKREEQTRFLLEEISPSKKDEIKRLFGEANDNSASVQAQKAMFFGFAEEFEKQFLSLKQNAESNSFSNEEPADPIYFYQDTTHSNPFEGGQILGKADVLRSMTKITIHSGEDKKLAEIYGELGDKDLLIKAVEQTIMTLSKKAALDLSDIFKTPHRKDGPSGTEGMS